MLHVFDLLLLEGNTDVTEICKFTSVITENQSRTAMKIKCFVIFMLLNYNTVVAQQGWIQSQLNPGMGYSFTKDDSVLYASTYDGVFSTVSDGMPWFSIGPATKAVYDIIITENSILAATVDGIYRSQDMGKTWQLISSEIICSGVGATQGNQVFTKNDSTIFIHTWARGVFKSDNDGESWKLLNIGTEQGLSGDLGGWATCIYSYNGKIFLGAPGGNIGIYYSGDNGNSWQKASAPIKVENESILFFTGINDTLYAGGFMGLYRSVDGGINWNPVYRNIINSQGQFSGIGTFRSLVRFNQLLIAAVDFKSIQISYDEGKTWADFNEGLIPDWTFADITIKPPYIWALTSFFGNAYRRSIADISTGIKTENTINDESYLEQNFPNPFNGLTTIRYTINKLKKAELSVYNVQGKLLMKLVDQMQSPGTYEVRLNAGNLEAGTYYYQLTTGDRSEIKKFTITK